MLATRYYTPKWCRRLVLFCWHNGNEVRGRLFASCSNLSTALSWQSTIWITVACTTERSKMKFEGNDCESSCNRTVLINLKRRDFLRSWQRKILVEQWALSEMNNFLRDNREIKSLQHFKHYKENCLTALKTGIVSIDCKMLRNKDNFSYYY